MIMHLIAELIYTCLSKLPYGRIVALVPHGWNSLIIHETTDNNKIVLKAYTVVGEEIQWKPEFDEDIKRFKEMFKSYDKDRESA